MRAQVSVGFIKPVIDRVVLDVQGAHRVGDDDVLNEVAELLIDSAITIDQRTAGKMGNWKPLCALGAVAAFLTTAAVVLRTY